MRSEIVIKDIISPCMLTRTNSIARRNLKSVAAFRAFGTDAKPAPAYLIGRIGTIHDINLYMDYVKPNVGILEPYGARFLVRGGKSALLQGAEGELMPDRIVFVQFPSLEKCSRWYNSDEYQRNRARRLQASQNGSIIAVAGKDFAKGSTSGAPAFIIVNTKQVTVDALEYSDMVEKVTSKLEQYDGSIIFDARKGLEDHFVTYEGEPLDAALGLRFQNWQLAQSWFESDESVRSWECQVLLLEGA